MWVFLFWMRDCVIFIEHLLNYKFAMLIESCLSVALAPHLLLRCMKSSINIIIIVVILIHKQHIIQNYQRAHRKFHFTPFLSIKISCCGCFSSFSDQIESFWLNMFDRPKSGIRFAIFNQSNSFIKCGQNLLKRYLFCMMNELIDHKWWFGFHEKQKSKSELFCIPSNRINNMEILIYTAIWLKWPDPVTEVTPTLLTNKISNLFGYDCESQNKSSHRKKQCVIHWNRTSTMAANRLVTFFFR